MNIGIDVRCLMDKHYSGIPEYSFNLLTNLFELDNKNQYLLFYNSQQPVEENLPNFKQNNVKYIGFKYPNKLFNLSLRFLHYPKLDQLIKGIDLFFMPNFNFIALSSNCKKVITVHDISFDLYPQYYTLKRNLWHKLINPKKILADFDTIITDSTNTKNDLVEQYQFQPEKISVIPLAIDHAIYKIIDKSNKKIAEVKEKYKLPAEFLFYLGTIEPRKNITSIIESFNSLKKQKKHQNLSLVIAGVKGWKYENVFQIAKNSPYKKQIHFIDYIPREDKSYIYNLAQVLLFPSYYEGFGLPVLEAQACGLPVICGLNSSLPEITNGSALLVNPFNLTDSIRAVQTILNSPKLKQELVNKGLKNSQKYTWQNTAKQTLKLFTL